MYYQALNKTGQRVILSNGTLQIVDEEQEQEVRLEPQSCQVLLDFLLLHMQEIEEAAKRKE